MAISDKLNYLIETKQLFKDRLNSLGAEIIESTTFRNYLNWLDNFYIGSANKTDIAINGIDGRTSQSGTPTPNSPQPINNLSGNVSYTVSGTNIETRTFTIPLGDIELCGMDTYKDRIYSQNGEFYLEKKTGKVVLDGSRNWTKSGNTNIDRFVLSGYVDYGDTNCFSNYFTNETYSDSNYNKSKIFLNTYSNTKRLIINFNTVGTTSLSNFKTWLSTHNTEVYYVLATPTTNEITEENYPTLYSQLLAIQEFLTKYKINKEFLLDYSSPEIEY